jgi:iron complex transport system ATP-binding protein
MPDPPLLLLDEPFAGLDLAGRELLIDTLDEVARARPERVVVLVTHHLEDVPGSITHGLLLRDGLVEAQGPLDDVLTDERVSACFGIRVRILKDNGRYTTVAPKTA